METRSNLDRTAKFSKMAPQFVVTDVVKTAEFYRDKLGFKILSYFLDPPVYAMVERDNVELHFGKADGDAMQTNEAVRRGLGSDVYIWIDDLDARFTRNSSQTMWRS